MGGDEVARSHALVSVVTPTYNRAALLQETLVSIALQDYRPLEVVVVDDCSTDSTPEVIAKWQRDLSLLGIGLRYHVQPENGGPAVARNRGLTIAKGSVIAFLDSDDLWAPGFLTATVELLDRHPAAGVAFARCDGIDAQGNVVPNRRPWTSGINPIGVLPEPFERFMENFMLPFITSATVVRREALDDVGDFDETLPIWQDADLWLRIAKKYDFAYTEEKLAFYRFHDGNISSRRIEWYCDQLRVTMRHLPDVRDPEIKRSTREQIRVAQTLLQEELLRERKACIEYDELLENELAPSSLRYRIGRLARHGPAWIGLLYALVIRWLGDARRMVAREVARVTAFMPSTGVAVGRRLVPRHAHWGLAIVMGQPELTAVGLVVTLLLAVILRQRSESPEQASLSVD